MTAEYNKVRITDIVKTESGFDITYTDGVVVEMLTTTSTKLCSYGEILTGPDGRSFFMIAFETKNNE